MKTILHLLVSLLKILAIAIIVIIAVITPIRLIDTDTLRDITPLKIPVGEIQLEYKYSDEGNRHNEGNTKRKSTDITTFKEYKNSVEEMLKSIKYVNVAESKEDQYKRVEWATPFEWEPGEKGNKEGCEKDGVVTSAALLIHGLTDTPFLMRDIGTYLNTKHCFLVRSILLPGHGTVPGDLLNIKAEDWIEASAYGINSILNEKEDIENLYIVGFSTGGTLALYHALYSADPDRIKSQNSLLNAKILEKLKGLILLSPAIQVKGEGSAKFANWHKAIYTSGPKWLSHEHGNWLDIALDKDFAKYESFPKNAADQIHRLSNRVYCSENKFFWEIPEFRDSFLSSLCDTKHLINFKTPVFIAISKQDETVNANKVKEFFNHALTKSNENEKLKNSSMLVMYATKDMPQENNIKWINVNNDDNKVGKYRILDLSHTAIPVSPCNIHYGNLALANSPDCLNDQTPTTNQNIYYNCVHYFSGNIEEINPEKYRECMGYTDEKNIVYGEKLSSELQKFCTSTSNIDKKECLKIRSTLRRLTFNPYFKQLTDEISSFLEITVIGHSNKI